MKPLLLDVERICELTEAEADAALLELWGEAVFAARNENRVLSMPAWKQMVNSTNNTSWRCRCAEEILLARASSVMVAPELIEKTADDKPFDEPSPSLSDLTNHLCAAAVIPLNDGPGTDSASLAHVWVVRGWTGPDHAGDFDGCSEWKARWSQYGLFHAGLKGSGMSGRSWQLGACCACELMNSPEHILTLARQWLITGSIEGDTVQGVDVLKKQTLPTRRTWLFPLSNSRDLTPRFVAHSQVRMTSSVSNAVKLITGQGVVEGGRELLPVNPDTLFTFVSEAWLVIMALVLLMRPKKLVMWHTRDEKKSMSPANLLVELIGKCCPEVQITPIQPISSHSMAECETALRVAVDSLPSGETALFNITNGNMLMRLAAHGICQLYPDKIRLIYRDYDAQPFEYTGIRFEGTPVTTMLTADSSIRNENITWERLFAPSKERSSWCNVKEIEQFIRKNPEASSFPITEHNPDFRNNENTARRNT